MLRPEDIPLNFFQRTALSRILVSRFGLIQLPTGCGKTRLAAAAIKFLRKNGLLSGGDVVLILSPRLVIREQIRREMEDILGKDFMVVEVDSSEKLQFYLTLASATSVNTYLLVATPQLLVSAGRREILRGVRLAGLILDEVHHTYTGDETSEVVEELIRRVVDGGGFAIGLTATPTKEARELLGGNLLYSALSAHAMAEGVLVGKLTIRYAETRFDCPPDVDPWKYEVPQRAEAYSKKILEVLGGKISNKVLVVAPNVSEADIIRDRLVEMLENTRECDARVLVRTAHYREQNSMDAINWFRETDRGILITVNMANMGFDVPDLEILILARRFNSPVAYTQVRGRVLRKPANTEAGARKMANGAILVDLVGSNIIHERDVPRVESGNLWTDYKVLKTELEGPRSPPRMDILTQVSEFREKVFDPKMLEEYVVCSLLKRPKSLPDIIYELSTINELKSIGMETVEAICTYLEVYGIVERKYDEYETEYRLHIEPINAIIWISMREGERSVEDGWVTLKKDRVEALLGEKVNLDSLLTRYNSLLRTNDDDKVQVFIKDWKTILKLEQKFEEINNLFESRLKSIETKIRRHLGKRNGHVDYYLTILSEVLLDVEQWNSYAEKNLKFVTKLLSSDTPLTIYLLVKGNLTDKTLIIRRISEAVSSLININIKVDIFDKGSPLKFSLEDIRREYYNLLRECEEQSKKRPDHASQIHDLKLKIQENLEKALDYVYREFKVILSKEANS